ncbi:hypothetical protein C7K25_15930, partial [Gulosibacter molinativorax]
EAMHDRLMALNASSAYRPLTYRSERGYRYAMARVEGAVTWLHDRWINKPRAEFTIAFRCADAHWNGESRKYTLTPGQTVTVENRGTLPAWPMVDVRGPLGVNWGLGVGSSRLYVDRAVGSGETVTVDHENGWVKSSSSGFITEGISGYESNLAPGVGTVTFTGSGSGSATVTFTDRFV